MHKNSFSAWSPLQIPLGELMSLPQAPPDLLVGWGGAQPLPILFPFDVFGTMPPAKKFLATPMTTLCVIVVSNKKNMLGYNMLFTETVQTMVG